MNKPEKQEPNKFAVLGKTKIIKGTILMPEMAGLRLVLTAASETGKPESDLYALLDKKWKSAKAECKGWHQHQVDYKLGNIHDTAVQSDTWLVHMLFVKKDGTVDPKALEACLKKLADKAKYEKGSVHVSTLLTTAFPTLQALLQKNLVEKGVSVFYYEESQAK